MQSKKLVLISDVPEDLIFAQKIAEIAGIPLTTTLSKNPKELESSVLLVDASTEAAYRKFEELMSTSLLDLTNPVHFIGSSSLHNSTYLAKKHLFGNYLVRDNKNTTIAATHYGKILKASLDYNSFGLRQFLDESKIHTFNFNSTRQKEDVQNSVLQKLNDWGFNGRMSQIILTGLDELLMNAMFDAPVNEDGVAIYEVTPRNTTLDLKLKSAVKLSFGCDDTHVFFSVSDNFGSLHRLRLLSYLSKMQAAAPYIVKEDTAGAGIGISMIHLSGGSLFFVSKAQEKTEVFLMFKKSKSFTDFRTQFKFIATQFYL
jgi:hypothetical protein